MSRKRNTCNNIGILRYEDSKAYNIVEKKIARDLYHDSKFKDLSHLASSSKGKCFEQLVEDLLTKNGSIVIPAKNSEHDRIIDGRLVEIKGSCLWKGSNKFCWQQIRPKEKDWEYIYFAAVYPDRIEIYKDNRANILSSTHLVPQHNGQKGRDTFWLQNCLPSDFQTWELVGIIN